MSQHDSQLLIDGLVMIAVIGLVLFRTLRTRRIDHGRLLRMPIIFAIIGVISIGSADALGSEAAVVLLAAELVLAVLFGVARGMTNRVWHDGDQWWTRGTALTLVLWLASFGIRFAAIPIGHHFGVASDASTGPIFLVLAVTFAAQNLVLARRTGALHQLTGVSA